MLQKSFEKIHPLVRDVPMYKETGTQKAKT